MSLTINREVIRMDLNLQESTFFLKRLSLLSALNKKNLAIKSYVGAAIANEVFIVNK